MHIYEYLFTAIIIFAMLIASSTIVITISQPQTTITDKEQLKITAQKIMTQLTLDPGDPPDWGSYASITPSDLTTFGLAKYGNSSREAYFLDPDKVQRLDSANPLYIPPYIALNLLNLATSYGITLDIYPTLDVEVTKTSPTADTYAVSVTTNDIAFPIANANVSARIFYYNSTSRQIEKTNLLVDQTTIDGRKLFDFSTYFTGYTTELKVLSVTVDYYGIHIARTLSIGTGVAEAYLIGNNDIGNHLLLTQSHTLYNNQTSEITPRKMSWGYLIENVTSGLTQANDTMLDVDYVEPSATAVMAIMDSGATLLLASRDTVLSYSSIPGLVSSPFSYSLERTVTIGDSSYIIKLQIWRMSF